MISSLFIWREGKYLRSVMKELIGTRKRKTWTKEKTTTIIFLNDDHNRVFEPEMFDVLCLTVISMFL